MTDCDLLIIGASTTGAYLGALAARKGLRVVICDKSPEDKIGSKYDIFHIEAKEFRELGLPRPTSSDPEWAFEFGRNYNASPSDRFAAYAYNPTVGLHMHDYTLLLCREAQKAGAEIRFGSSFKKLVVRDGTVRGAVFVSANGEEEIAASVVADCSGIPAAARSSLPASLGMETFVPGGSDMFYVVLRYVTIKDPADYLAGSSRFWAFYKSWIAPCADPHGAIIGIGACHGYDRAEKIYASMLEHVRLPEHDVVRVERACTPYTRPPYTLVTDGFIACGDAACLTKPLNGEGVTSSMYHARIAAEVVSVAVRRGDCSKESLWQINDLYNRIQGADFSSTRALMTGIVNAATFDEFEFAFSSGIISNELLSGGSSGAGLGLSPAVLASAAAKLVYGAASKKISRSTLAAAGKALSVSSRIKQHYLDFPKTPEGFTEWCAKADLLWDEAGKMD
ncbi:MAG: NAD(P)/FAD-dependent oxidoreductase [Clostridia bacterium]|nr:NAD(P)/FAD-dependent oxidoreductase [Clostridia bacterium]